MRKNTMSQMSPGSLCGTSVVVSTKNAGSVGIKDDVELDAESQPI